MMCRLVLMCVILNVLLLSHEHSVKADGDSFTHLIPLAKTLIFQPIMTYTHDQDATLKALGSSMQSAMKNVGWGDAVNKNDDILSPKALSKDVAAPLRSRYLVTNERMRNIFTRLYDMSDEFDLYGDVISQKCEKFPEYLSDVETAVIVAFQLFVFFPALDKPTQIDAAFLNFLDEKCTAAEKSLNSLEAKTDKLLVKVPGTRAYKRRQKSQICIGIIIGVAVFVVIVIVIAVVVRNKRKPKSAEPTSLNMSHATSDLAYMRS